MNICFFAFNCIPVYKKKQIREIDYFNFACSMRDVSCTVHCTYLQDYIHHDTGVFQNSVEQN